MTDHRTVGFQYAVTSLLFLLVGFLLMLLMRWQLAWPGQPLPAWLVPLLGDANAPGGIMLPEFYNQLVAMHGTVMIFLAVVPMAAGAFGTLLVPQLIGAAGMALPRVSSLAFWLYAAGGAVMVASFFVDGGAANSGWTAYPPLSILATKGQTWWLVGMVFVSGSATLGAIAMITTIVRSRAPGVTLSGMPFFVWAQLVTALLLLLAFPALQAAAVFQLMDRTAGTSFFLPSGLVIGGIPLQDYSGGGSPILWQHLFWFLAHPEVYVLVLPAMGIVSEVIVSNTRRPLWGYGLMVSAVLFLGLMSMLVWAHHMFLTGMGTTLSTFFQITTMIVSIPSVVLITALVLSLWGGSIRFPTAMLFALAFLPMFGLGGLTGLPLGLAASDITLHDTYYVVAHFHYLVAPGTMFALFAGIYHWFPAVTGRALSERLGKWHFWLSFYLINNIFLPMFVIGLAGVNRRMYDAGLQFALAQPFQALQRHMTWSALALGVAQIPFLVALVMAFRRSHLSAPAGTRSHLSAPASTWPHPPAPASTRSHPPAPARTRSHPPAPDLPVWLLVAWLAMFFGSLLSGYVLLRTGNAEWPHRASGWGLALGGSALLLASAVVTRPSRAALLLSAAPGAALVAWLTTLHGAAFEAGRTPAAHLEFASWFTLTGMLLTVIALGCMAAAWSAFVRSSSPARARGLRIVWGALSLIWLVLLSAFSVA
ncbi:MAG: cbb3-type cytochrome c oxidase subunit I [Acidobacteria bacterium]|nr:cbb3-type cytochrome c oxidase subunit I [Acidobacteriota bacterium]